MLGVWSISGGGSGFSRLFKLISASRMIPHPHKASTGGEDACFIAEDHKTVDVADGRARLVPIQQNRAVT
jgi:hypothetical protein